MKFYLERYPNNERPAPILVPRKKVEWEAKAVFNPGVVYDNGVFNMLYRTYPDQLQETEPRFKRPGYFFKNQVSYIGYAKSKNPLLLIGVPILVIFTAGMFSYIANT